MKKLIEKKKHKWFKTAKCPPVAHALVLYWTPDNSHHVYMGRRLEDGRWVTQSQGPAVIMSLVPEYWTFPTSPPVKSRDIDRYLEECAKASGKI